MVGAGLTSTWLVGNLPAQGLALGGSARGGVLNQPYRTAARGVGRGVAGVGVAANVGMGVHAAMEGDTGGVLTSAGWGVAAGGAMLVPGIGGAVALAAFVEAGVNTGYDISSNRQMRETRDTVNDITYRLLDDAMSNYTSQSKAVERYRGIQAKLPVTKKCGCE